jgi:hypothetical protein
MRGLLPTECDYCLLMRQSEDWRFPSPFFNYPNRCASIVSSMNYQCRYSYLRGQIRDIYELNTSCKRRAFSGETLIRIGSFYQTICSFEPSGIKLVVYICIKAGLSCPNHISCKNDRSLRHKRIWVLFVPFGLCPEFLLYIAKCPLRRVCSRSLGWYSVGQLKITFKSKIVREAPTSFEGQQ